jgi:ribose transport system substrate-binding protein
MKRRSLITLAAAATMAATGGLGVQPVFAQSKEIVYMTPALDVPFWRIVSKGVESVAKKEGYAFSALEAQNNAARQLKNAQDAIARGVAGIVISPTIPRPRPAC